jgi:conjugal transfer pilus assembly protein TraF
LVYSTALGGEFDRDERWGFFWYDDKKEIKKELKAPSKKKPLNFPPLKPDNYSYEELWRMHPDHFKEVIDTRLKLAVQYPENEDNILKFIEAQDVAKRKSLAFTGSMAFVSQKYPQYDEDAAPQNLMGKNARQNMLQEKKHKILSEAKDEFGLIVFMTSDCAYCDAQKPIIDEFEFTYGWLVERFDITRYMQLAHKYNISTTPAVLIVSKKNGAALSVSRGVVPLSELKNRIINAILYLTGKRNPENFIHNLSSDPLKFNPKGHQNVKEDE